MGHKWDRDVKRPPTLAEQRVDAPEEPPHRARKDTKRWCRGKVGREHAPGIRLSTNARARAARGLEVCGWKPKDHWSYELRTGRRGPATEQWWDCEHERCCVVCGKTLSPAWPDGVGDDCPVKPTP